MPQKIICFSDSEFVLFLWQQCPACISTNIWTGVPLCLYLHISETASWLKEVPFAKWPVLHEPRKTCFKNLVNTLALASLKVVLRLFSVLLQHGCQGMCGFVL